MKLSTEEVKRIALLARMGLSGEETERLRGQLSSILENFEELREVDTSGVLPTAHVAEVGTVMRQDRSAPSLPPGDVLANAPMQEEGFFRVRAVLE